MCVCVCVLQYNTMDIYMQESHCDQLGLFSVCKIAVI